MTSSSLGPPLHRAAPYDFFVATDGQHGQQLLRAGARPAAYSGVLSVKSIFRGASVHTWQYGDTRFTQGQHIPCPTRSQKHHYAPLTGLIKTDQVLYSRAVGDAVVVLIHCSLFHRNPE